MEFPGTGQQCSESECKQLDFLPLQCECKKVFCSEHFRIHTQTCPELKSQGEIKQEKTQSYQCSQINCKNVVVVPLICEKCLKCFCVEHRHTVQCEDPSPDVIAAEKEKYAAPIRKFNEAKTAVEEELDKNISNAKKKAKTVVVANKVQLMRIKNKAVGMKTIPTADRIYFNVKLPEKGKIVPIFISKTWTLGRVIDAIAQECKLLNNNNKSDVLKLRLFLETGDIVSSKMSDSMEFLLYEKVVMDGSELILTYVQENCFHLSL